MPQETPEAARTSRRDFIRRGAVVGSVVWAAPVIQSFTNAARAGSPAPFTCSYAMLVFTFNGGPRYVVKWQAGTQGCVETASTSSDATFSYKCNKATWDNSGDGNKMQRNNVTLTPYPGDCNELFIVDGNTITPMPGVDVEIAVIHSGQFPPKFDMHCNTGTNEIQTNCPDPA